MSIGIVQVALRICLTACVVAVFAQAGVPADDPRLAEGVSLAIDAQYAKALRVFQTLLREDPENPQLNYLAGAACIRMDRLGEGIDYLETSIKRNARFPQAFTELAEAYLKRKMKDKARLVAEEGLKLFPKNEQIRRTRAKIGD